MKSPCSFGKGKAMAFKSGGFELIRQFKGFNVKDFNRGAIVQAQKKAKRFELRKISPDNAFQRKNQGAGFSEKSKRRKPRRAKGQTVRGGGGIKSRVRLWIRG